MYNFSDCYGVPKDSDLHKFGIYCIENKIDGRQYVGSTTKSFVKRIQKHLLALKSSRHHSKKFQACFNKSDPSDYFVIILEVLEDKSREFVKEREQFWLDKLQPFYNMYKEAYLYSADYQHTEDTKKKLTEVYRSRARDKDIGVSYCPTEDNWCLRISVKDLGVYSLGRFKTKDEGLTARKKAETVFWSEEFENLPLEEKKIFAQKYRNSKPTMHCTSGYRYIQRYKMKSKFWKFVYNNQFIAGFCTLEEAVEFRDKYLEENNLI